MSGERSPIRRIRRAPVSRAGKRVRAGKVSAAGSDRLAVLLAERRRALAQIKLLAQAVKSVTESVYVTDRDDRILFVNQAFLETYGYRESDVVGRPVDMLGAEGGPGPSFAEIWPAALAGGWRGEVTHRRRDGSAFPVFLSTTVVHDDDGLPLGLVGVTADISERKRVAEQVAQVQKIEAVGRLAGGVAHDFNNLLQAMLSHAQLLEAHYGDHGRVVQTIAELTEQIRRGTSLTRQLLLFSRRETARTEPLDFNDVVRSASGLLERLVRENIALQLELARGPLPVEANRGQLEQVVMNLVVNASDAMPDGGRLIIRTGREGKNWVFLAVEDTGHGIPRAVRQRMFEPFFTTKGPSQGTGLGLSVVQGIVQEHFGRIEVKSRVGTGSTFRVKLPSAPACTLVPAPPSASEPQDWTEAQGERVLLVEDEKGTRDALAEILDVLGYRVVAVGSAEEAGVLPSHPAFDLLLSDLVLPGASGAELARGPLDRWPHLVVVLMSGYTEDEVQRLGVDTREVRFLQKPFDMISLACELRAALADAEPALV
jgi:two-component system, cell cycle sensor histidine kinase and response regulator CckA